MSTLYWCPRGWHGRAAANVEHHCLCCLPGSTQNQRLLYPEPSGVAFRSDTGLESPWHHVVHRIRFVAAADSGTMLETLCVKDRLEIIGVGTVKLYPEPAAIFLSDDHMTNTLNLPSWSRFQNFWSFICVQFWSASLKLLKCW